MGDMLFKTKTFLSATMGCTVKGSSDGSTGGMDGIDRWVSVASCVTQGAQPTSAQSWIAMVDGNGSNILLANQGSSADICFMAFSAGGNYIAAGTPTAQPTTTDESQIMSGTSVINNTASGDRILHLWGSSDKKMFRAMVTRASTLITMWGVERFTSMVDPLVTVSPPVWGFFYTGAQTVTNTGGSQMLAVGGTKNSIGGHFYQQSGTPSDVVCGGGLTLALGASGAGVLGVEKPDLQGGNTHVICGMYITSTVAGYRGIAGLRIDWWFSYNNSSLQLGDFYGASQFVGISPTTANTNGGAFWPWDGASTFISA